MREEHYINRQGKRYVLFAGLLDEAHRQGLRSIDTELIQAPSKDNGEVAIVKATVKIARVNSDGEVVGEKTFEGIGDASPDNVGKNIKPHLLRMAETRSKARALRDAVNISAQILEDA